MGSHLNPCVKQSSKQQVCMNKLMRLAGWGCFHPFWNSDLWWHICSDYSYCRALELVNWQCYFLNCWKYRKNRGLIRDISNVQDPYCAVPVTRCALVPQLCLRPFAEHVASALGAAGGLNTCYWFLFAAMCSSTLLCPADLLHATLFYILCLHCWLHMCFALLYVFRFLLLPAGSLWAMI